MKALIFNSGVGKRLGTLTQSNPKCLLRLLNGETLLSRQIRLLNKAGIFDFVITTGPFDSDVRNECSKFKKSIFTFVYNDKFETTNYIYSMFLASPHLNDDFIMLHGDLVFDFKAILKMINSKHESTCYINTKCTLPIKDFKGRIKNGRLDEVSINIFDENCFALQPLYKLNKKTLLKWKRVVELFIVNGNTTVYAENALNTICSCLNIYPLSYSKCFIEEIDTPEDYESVSKKALDFDRKEQDIIFNCADFNCIVQNMAELNVERPLVVCDSFAAEHEIIHLIKQYFGGSTIFSSFAPNPTIEMLNKGLDLFLSNNCDSIISLGGGTSIDIAKCIKISSLKNNFIHLFDSDYSFVYPNIPHIAIPSTSGTGSESTSFAVLYKDCTKYSIDNPSLLPESVFLFPSLIESTPLFVKKCTMLDALCQGIESYWAVKSTKTSKIHALNAVRLVLTNYEGYLNNDRKSIVNMQKAANESGKAINISHTTAAHALSYGLTSLYGIPHGLAVALVLPKVWNYIPDGIYRRRFNKILKDYSGTDKSNCICYFNNFLNEINVYDKNLWIFGKKDIQYLISHVNTNRLTNFPYHFSKQEIKSIYEEIC